MKYIGCSGYYYKDWSGKFYPSDLKKEDFLPFYAKKFNSVEINNTFYNLPLESTFKGWDEKTPKSFGFTIKGSRYITHQKKLKIDQNLRDAVKKFFSRVELLEDKLKCILWQLPSNLHRNDDKLRDFTALLPEDIPYCFEFRHPSWLDEQVYTILEDSNAVFCSLSSPEEEINTIVKGKRLSYFRFHGEKKSNWYNYFYHKDELRGWADTIKSTRSKDIFAYFNNDMGANAPKNAETLRELLKT